VIVYFFTLLVFILIYKINRFTLKKLFLQPLSFAIFGVVFITIIVPIIQYLDNYYHFANYSWDIKLSALTYALLYLMVLVLSYKIFKPQNDIHVFHTYSLSLAYERKLVLANIILVVFCTLSLIKVIHEFDYSTFLANRITLLKGFGGLILPIYSLSLLTCLFYIKKTANLKSLKNIIFFGSLLLFQLLVFSLVGNRNSFFITVFLLFLTVLFFGKRLTITKKVKNTLMIVIVLLLFTVTGYMRMRLSNQLSLSTIYANLDEIIVSGFIKVFLNHELLQWLMQFPNKWELQHGNTFLAAISNFIPREIWPDKPLGAGPIIRNFIFPGSYYIGGENLTSYTTGIITESFMNFSWLGIVFVAPFHGIILAQIDRLRRKSFTPLTLALYFYCLYFFCFAIFFSEFLGLLSRFIGSSLIFWVIYFINRKQIARCKRELYEKN